MTESSSDHPTLDAGTLSPGIRMARLQVEAARLRQRDMIASGRLGDSSDTASMPPADCLPGYTLLRELNRGGQGVVYQAMQESTRRKVAIKVLRHGPFAGAAEVQRFQREVELLGRLKHPNVVTIHDCGRAGEDVFLVMDYIDGRPLDDHVTHANLSPTQTLGLFAKICDGVNAAHLRGVIHRDLKPGNIRVDEAGEPRVLDFGLAKLAGQPEGGSSAQVMTMTGQFVGSLPWASPEQAEGRWNALDIRTDVYSLGVILYHLLTGQFPYPVAGRMDEVVRHIAHTSPARPSTVQRSIGHEVETILLKCLTKEPERRYQSAGELARDIRHYLAGDAIEAKRDSLRYVLRKHLRRHRVAVAVVASFLVLLALGMVTSLTYWYRAEHAVVEKEDQRRQADEQRLAAQSNAERADREATNAKQQAAIAASVNTLVTEMLARADRAREKGNPNVTVREVMDAAVAELDAKPGAYEPAVEAAVRHIIGRTYRSLSRVPQSEAQLRAAIDLQRRTVGADPVKLAQMLSDLGLLELFKRVGDFGVATNREALEIRRAALGNAHELVAVSLHNVAMGLHGAGQSEEAERLTRKALAIRIAINGEDHVDVAKSLAQLAVVVSATRQDREPMDLMERAVGIYERHDPTNANLGMLLGNLAIAKEELGDHVGAESRFEQALDRLRALYGDDDMRIGFTLVNRGINLYMFDRDVEAEKVLQRAIAMFTSAGNIENPMVFVAQKYLAYLSFGTGRPQEAADILSEFLPRERKQHQPGQYQLGLVLPTLGAALNQLERPAEAEPLLREAVAIFDEPCAPRRQHRRALHLGYMPHAWQAPDARSALGESLVLQARVLVRDTRASAGRVGEQNRSALSLLEEAESLLVSSEERLTHAAGTHDPAVPGSQSALLRMHRDAWINSRKRLALLYEVRHALEPKGGFDQKAADWRARLADEGPKRPSIP